MVAAESGLCFGPDTLVEARNRGYHPHRSVDGAAAGDSERAALDHTFPSGGLTPEPTWPGPPPGAPTTRRWSSSTASRVVRTGPRPPLPFPELGDRIAAELGWLVLVPAPAAPAAPRATSRWVGGSTTSSPPSPTSGRRSGRAGSGLPASAPARLEPGRRRPGSRFEGRGGVARWPTSTTGRASRAALQHSRSIGLIRDPAFPASFDQWSRELRDIRADRSIAEVAPRPVLIVHGTDDESVPAFDARVVADAHGSAELMLSGAGHALRHDRFIAVLLGWLDRQRSTLFV